jgi:hypothetical protein
MIITAIPVMMGEKTYKDKNIAINLMLQCCVILDWLQISSGEYTI